MPGTMSGDCSMATLNPAEWRNSSTSSTATSRSYPRHPSSQLHDSSARPRAGTHSVRWCSIGPRVPTAPRTPAKRLTCDYLVTYPEVVDGDTDQVFKALA